MKRMPAEFEQHAGTILIWPVRPGSWTYGGKNAQQAFREIAKEISSDEKVYLICDDDHYTEICNTFSNHENILPIVLPTNDAWARDIGPTFVEETDDHSIHGINWKFNAWGGDFDGLYKDYEDDDMFASTFCKTLNYPVIDEHDFVLEGGSIHVDGEGTLITTEACLLSPGRNPDMTREQIEERLCNALGVKKVIWLPNGILGDETNEHVDNFCCFIKPGEVVMAWTDDESNPQHEACVKNYEILTNTKDAKNRTIKVHKLPLPKNPVVITKKDLDGFVFEEGEDVREEGEKLAASYANFYIANKKVLVPQFSDPNDSLACQILGELFPRHEIIPIEARDIIVGGGNIHCITQQVPLKGDWHL